MASNLYHWRKTQLEPPSVDLFLLNWPHARYLWIVSGSVDIFTNNLIQRKLKSFNCDWILHLLKQYCIGYILGSIFDLKVCIFPFVIHHFHDWIYFTLMSKIGIKKHEQKKNQQSKILLDFHLHKYKRIRSSNLFYRWANKGTKKEIKEIDMVTWLDLKNNNIALLLMFKGEIYLYV